MDEIKYGGAKRKWNSEFINYMKMIVANTQYKGIPWAIDDEKQIRWNAPSNRPPGGKWSNLHDERLEWWREKAKEIGIKEKGHWISEVAKKIHPTGKKPCQTCGKTMFLSYVYPTKTTINKINKHLSEEDKLDYFEFKSIYDVCDYLFDAIPDKMSEVLHEIFPKIPSNKTGREEIKLFLEDKIVPTEPKGKLSPGAMSNAPDRLDGFHTYNICCRSKQDTGRDLANLRTYTDDRRAFEQWCEGNWAAANLLMNLSSKGICERCGKFSKITADHIGPISLGFAHTPYFAPMCTICNSGKNNRMSLLDINLLLGLERKGIEVVSWQSKDLWDRCKNKIKTDSQALLLSKLLRINQHHYLGILNLFITEKIPDILLQFLNPDYVKYKYQFVNLDVTTFRFSKIVKSPRSPSYIKSKAARMTRIAFEALLEYGNKEKRNIQNVDEEKVCVEIVKLHKQIEKARKEKSKLREDLNAALEIRKTTERIELLESIFRSHLKPAHDFTYLKKAMSGVLRAIADILEKRFVEDRAIRTGD